MKIKNLFIAIIGLAMATLYGCGSSGNSGNSDSSKDKITVTGGDGKVYESYQECCAANDYEAAHQFLAKLQNSESDAYSYGEAKEYVFKNEALFLMSQDDETAKKRIIYLLKEEGNNDDHVSMLVDLAIENDDDAFVKKLANQYSEKASIESLQKLMSYLSDKPTEENKIFIGKLIDKYLSLSNTAMLEYMARTKSKEDSERILGLLAEEEKGIPTRPALGTIKVHDPYGGDNMDSDYVNYQYEVSQFNSQCNSILSIAIKCKNTYLAQRAVAKTKTNISYRNLGDWEHVVTRTQNNSWNYAWKVTLDNTEANAIKAAYQEAVRSGAFK